MKLSICTDVFGRIPFTQMLDTVKAYGLDGIEMTASGWGGCNFIPSAAELIQDQAKREAFQEEIAKRGLEISALNCSGNPLIDTPMGREHSRTMHDTVTLAGLLGVKGCRAHSPDPDREWARLPYAMVSRSRKF